MKSKLSHWLSLARAIKAKTGRSIAAMAFENLLLFVFRGVGPRYYFEARIWRQELTWRQKQAYSDTKHYKKLLNALNQPQYRKISQHKLVEKAMLNIATIPNAEFIGFYHPERGFDSTGTALCCRADLHALFASRINRRMCCKLLEGWGGNGFRCFTPVKQDTAICIKDRALDQILSLDDWLSRFAEQPEGVILEDYIQQHPVLAALNPDSVNTLRVWVINKPSGAEVLGVILRIGRKGSATDNAGQGGFIAQLHQQTGTIIKAMSCEILPDEFDQHPDTGQQITGVCVPFWHESLNLAKRALLTFPNTSFAGLDIAISNDGPMLVELNLEPDKVTARNFGKPLSQLLNVNA